jgi:hypothetical protein
MTIPSSTLGTQIANKPNLYAYGCQHLYASATTITVTSGQLRDSTNTFDIVVPNDIVVSTSFVGAGGLDEGVVQPDTFYAVYVLYDYTHTNNPVGLLSKNPITPVMPSINGVTYSALRLIGYIKTIPVGNDIYGFRIIGTGNDRQHIWDNVSPSIIGGTATTYTPLSLSNAVPNILGLSATAPKSIGISTSSAITPTAAGNSLELSNFNELFAQFSSELSAVVAAVRQTGELSLAADFTSALDYKIKYRLTGTGGSADVQVSSFTFPI